MRRAVMWLVAILLTAALVYAGGCVFGYRGSGSAELELELQVLDAETGLPIPGAMIEIISGDGFPEKCDEKQTEPIVVYLQTDEIGVVRIHAGKRFVETVGNMWGESHFSVRPPVWRYEVSAPSYSTSQPNYLFPGIGGDVGPQQRTAHGTVKQVLRWRLEPEQ